MLNKYITCIVLFEIIHVGFRLNSARDNETCRNDHVYSYTQKLTIADITEQMEIQKLNVLYIVK